MTSAATPFRNWRSVVGKLARVLCLADPWVSAVAGTVIDA